MDGSRGGSRAPAGGGGWQRLEATLKFLESSTSDRIDGLEGVRDALASCGSFPPRMTPPSSPPPPPTSQSTIYHLTASSLHLESHGQHSRYQRDSQQ